MTEPEQASGNHDLSVEYIFVWLYDMGLRDAGDRHERSFAPSSFLLVLFPREDTALVAFDPLSSFYSRFSSFIIG
jgi:hypothetical protein